MISEKNVPVIAKKARLKQSASYKVKEIAAAADRFGWTSPSLLLAKYFRSFLKQEIQG